jgi:hypothetical protein
MNQTEVFQAVVARCRGLGANVLPRDVIMLSVSGITAHVSPWNLEELTETEPAQRAARAVLAVAEFAAKANTITESERLTATAKSADILDLARASAPELSGLLAAADAALEAAVLVERREVAPVPIEAADAAQSVVDVELRGILRAAGGLGEQISMVQQEFAICRATLRQPTGFPEPVIEHARKAWADFNPAKQTSTAAQRVAASWREARRIIGQAQHALNTLSSGRDRRPGTLAAA